MPYRVTPLVNGYVYHIYNRGNEKRNIFYDNRDRKRFLKTLQYYKFGNPKPRLSEFLKSPNFIKGQPNQIVEIIAYCLMPNHFHLLVRQLEEGGIVEFMRKACDSYTKYLNIKHKRVGSLLQAAFRALLVESDEQLFHVSRYIHLNPLTGGITASLENYPWSSYTEYTQDIEPVCSKDIILGQFKSKEAYRQFIDDQKDYAFSLEILKHHLIDEE